MRVVEVWRYPVKSAQGEMVPGSPVGTFGLEWDRQLAVVDVATDLPLTGRREPNLLMLSASVVAGEVRITTPEGALLATVDELSAWLGRRVRLAPPPDTRPRYEYPLDNEDEAGPWSTWSGPAGVWHDSTRTRISIMSTASLRAWPSRRFRSNLVVDGAGEDDLIGRRIAIGSVMLDVVKRIDRCVMVTRPQPGGIERDLTVLRTVARDHGGFLGVGAVIVTPGELHAGDQLIDQGPA